MIDDGLERYAQRDATSVAALAAELVRIPSRAGIDDYGPITTHVSDWLRRHDLQPRTLTDAEHRPVAVAVDVRGVRPGPTWVLDACLDTAPFGDEEAWTFSPTEGDIVDGWLRGRGAADSKVAASLFCHLALAIRDRRATLRGSLCILLDVDEHTGNFGGAKSYVAEPRTDSIAGIMIGYPGLEHVVVGGRGVMRATMKIFGLAAHSGSSHPAINAIARAATLITALESTALPPPITGGTPLPPKLTVTTINGGSGFSVVPDVCEINVDIRLTDQLNSGQALDLLVTAAKDLDDRIPAPRPTAIAVCQDWPPYQLTERDQPAAALIAGARAAGITVSTKVAGPTNIGNYLAGFGIPATAGFGLPYTGMHGTDERAHLDALVAVHRAYHYAVLNLMDGLPTG